MDKESNVRGASGDKKDDKRVRKFIIGGAIALLVLVAVLLIFLLPKKIRAIDIRIQRLVGIVNLLDEKGKDLSLSEKMKLNSGQTLSTADESLVMMSLDEIKLVTLEAESKAKIKTYGRELEFELTEGDLFFNVTEKLPNDEKFDIRTSNMLCGIRGTSGFAGKDDTGHDILMVTDGDVAVKAFNPVTKETRDTVVHAGEMITIYLDEEAEGDATVSFICRKFREEDLPALALDAIRKDEALQKRINAATGFNTKKIVELAKVNSKNGISMYGSAADDLAKAGIEDAIPVMGSPARDMVRTANRAVDTAKDDLDLEISIIKGMRDVLDTGLVAGANKEELSELMTNSTTCVIETIEHARRVGLKGEALSRVSASVAGTLSNSIRDMKGSNLSRQEVADVVEAIGTVYGNAMDEAKQNGLDESGIESALNGASDFAKATVNTEMNKSATGDETVIALLGRGGTDTANAGDDKDSTKKNGNGTDTDTANANGNANGNDDGNGNADGNGAGTNGNDNANGRNGAGNGNNYQKPSTFTPGLLEPGIEPDVSDHVNEIDKSTGKLTLTDGTVFDPVYYAAANPDAFAKYGYNTNDLLYDYLNKKSSSEDGNKVYASADDKKQKEEKAYQEFAKALEEEYRAQQEAEAAKNMVASAEGIEESSGGSSGGGGNSGGGGGNTNAYQPSASGDFSIGPANLWYNQNASSNMPAVYVMNGSVTLPFTYVDKNGQNVDVTSLSDIGLMPSASASVSYNGTYLNKSGTNKGDVYSFSGGGGSGTELEEYSETANTITIFAYQGNTQNINYSETLDKTTGAVTIWP